MKLFKQSFLLILSFAFVYFWQKTPLGDYTIQVLGFLVFLFLITSARRKNFDIAGSLGEGSLAIFILNTIILLLIYSTGIFNSTLFFLLYFLGFGIAFVFEPVIVFVFAVGVTLIFLEEALQNDVARNFILLGSLGLISPLAYFFGKSYRKSEEDQAQLEAIKERTTSSADTISEDIDEVLESEKKTLKPEDVEKLNEILEETETLREEKKPSY